MTGKIKIRLVRSTIGTLPKQRATVRSLGLGKIGSVVCQDASPSVLGMVKRVSHLVAVEEVPAAQGQEGDGNA
jgi:large subunit ribosomal protein L30